MKRVVAAVLVVALQVGVLGYMIYERESTLLSGQVVYLRTMPVDPRDPFRGDYVALAYQINRVALTRVDPAVQEIIIPDTVVYGALSVDARGIADISRVSLQPPEQGLFIRGRLVGRHDWRWPAGEHELPIRYGVEKLFVPQGDGIKIEERRGIRTGWQTPMEVAVAINSAGTPVIRDYRWSDVAIKLEDITVRPSDPREARENSPSPHLRFGIRNVSEQPVALVMTADYCHFELEAADGKPITMAYGGCPSKPIAAADLTVLPPGAEVQRDFNLVLPRWHVKSDTLTGEIAKLENWQRFRLVYRAPALEQLAENISQDQRQKLWQGTLYSPAFNNRGNVD
jgi:uncharacterized membrane-anchored protein